MKPLLAIAVLSITLAVLPSSALSEGITSEQADAILKELREIRQLLERQQSQALANTIPPPAVPQIVKVSVAGAPTLGKDDAPLTLVEFTDYECAFCRQFHLTAFEELKKTYIDTGRVRFVSRDLPLEFHKHAGLAAEAARCAGDQGKYWETRHALMGTAAELSPEKILSTAQAVAPDGELLKVCLDTRKYQPAVQKDFADAHAVAITGTPTFVLGRTAPDQIEGALIVGAQPYVLFDSKIKELLGTEVHPGSP